LGKGFGFYAEDVDLQMVYEVLLITIRDFSVRGNTFYNLLHDLYKFRDQPLFDVLGNDHKEILLELGEPDYTWLPAKEHYNQ